MDFLFVQFHSTIKLLLLLYLIKNYIRTVIAATKLYVIMFI